MAERKARRMVVLLQRLAELEIVIELRRELVEARFLDPGDAIVEQRARRAERKCYPAVAAHAVFARGVEPAAGLLAEMVGDVGEVDELLGIKMRVVEPAQDDV